MDLSSTSHDLFKTLAFILVLLRRVGLVCSRSLVSACLVVRAPALAVVSDR